MARFIEMLGTAAGPNGVLHAGKIYRVDNATADKYLKGGQQIGGRVLPAARIVTDPVKLREAREIEVAGDSDDNTDDE